MNEPAWLNRHGVILLQSESLAQHGGSSGIRDAGLLDSALTRPINKWNYNPAAAGRIGGCLRIRAGTKPPVRGWKQANRFHCDSLFLHLNGYRLFLRPSRRNSNHDELAAGELSEEEFAVG